MKGFYIEFYGTHNQDDDRDETFQKIVGDLRDALRPAGFEVAGEYAVFDSPVSEVATAIAGPPVEEGEAPIDVPEGGGIIEEAPVEGVAVDTSGDYPGPDQGEPQGHLVVDAVPAGMLWILNPSAWGIDSLKVSIPGAYTETEIQAMLTLERNGKGRVGAVGVFEKALDAMIHGEDEPEPDDPMEGYGYV